MANEFTDLWIPAGIVFAFQIQMVRWRVDREASMENSEERTWLPLCDYLNLASMAATAYFVFVAPLLLAESIPNAFEHATFGFGLSVILLIGYLVSLLGHYRLFFGGRGPRPYLPVQELVPLLTTIGSAASYAFVAWPL